MHDMRAGTCAVCLHPEVIRASAVEFSGKFHREVPLAVTHEPNRSFFGPHPVDQPIGPLEMLVCRKCGFVQWFAANPAGIPIGEKYKTSLVTAATQGSYR